jgi:sucrose-phosphate synthase
LVAQERPAPRAARAAPHPSDLLAADRLAIFDIDNTLVGDAEALDELKTRLEAQGPRVVFGVATGRRPDSAIEVLEAWGAPSPGVVVACVGSEIYYGLGEDLLPDEEWALHIDHRWRPEAIREALDDLPGLTLQEAGEQRRFKVSYFVDAETGPSHGQVVARLKEHEAPAQVIHSHGEFLDLLPVRASKGLAIVYLAEKWDIPLSRVLVAGDSGNDLEMLTADTLAVVVGNHAEELTRLRGKDGIYFADATHAAGILEGAEHWGFFGEPDGR